jgi:hypothetical protein
MILISSIIYASMTGWGYSHFSNSISTLLLR